MAEQALDLASDTVLEAPEEPLVNDVGHQMAPERDAVDKINSTMSGARRIYNLFGDAILKWASGHGVDPYLGIAIMGAETGGSKPLIYGPNTGPSGGAGIGQFEPETWEGVTRLLYGEPSDPAKRFDPNVAGPAVYARMNRFSDEGIFDPEEIAAAYSVGPGIVKEFKAGVFDELPPETGAYMTAVVFAMHMIEREILSDTVPEEKELVEEPSDLPASDMMQNMDDDQLLSNSLRGS